ncbi:Tryptophan/tyrosine permease family-domain-containing protein [Tribonema minus]|uniref:Tryptophan/tyrosine permease family-domain-containing protein n=1 Tax=Tribonema minus TaxID=303371 RepID=A0A835YXW1_9STRA|nr:Tryptophan/tyrosine permease family-domain-containing protein [Tribonema minus]
MRPRHVVKLCLTAASLCAPVYAFAPASRQHYGLLRHNSFSRGSTRACLQASELPALDVEPLQGLDASDEATTNSEQSAQAGNTGNVLTAAALIAGTTIGGGFLGLPYYTAPLGAALSSAMLIGSWAYLLANSLLLAHLCCAVMRETGSPAASVFTVARRTLGRRGARALSAGFFFLLNATLVSQLARAGGVVAGLTGLPHAAACALPCALMAAAVFGAPARAVDGGNAALTAGMMAAFAGVVAVNMAWLLRGSSAGAGAAITAVPVVMQLLVYTEMVPLVCERLGGDERRTAAALALGSLPPLLMCLSWSLVALGLVPPAAGAALKAGGDPVNVLLRQGGSMGALVSALAACAITTTVAGSYLALSQFLWDALGARRGGGRREGEGKGQGGARGVSALGVAALTVVPSLLLAVTSPGAFYAAVEFAGAYPVTILWCIGPPLMMWAAKYGLGAQKAWLSASDRWAGKGVLAALGGVAVALLGMSAAGHARALLSAAASLMSKRVWSSAGDKPIASHAGAAAAAANTRSSGPAPLLPRPSLPPWCLLQDALLPPQTHAPRRTLSAAAPLHLVIVILVQSVTWLSDDGSARHCSLGGSTLKGVHHTGGAQFDGSEIG